MQDNFKYSRIKKIHQVLEKITRFDQNIKIHCVLLSHELLSTSTKIILHINLHILVIIYFKTNLNIQK